MKGVQIAKLLVHAALGCFSVRQILRISGLLSLAPLSLASQNVRPEGASIRAEHLAAAAGGALLLSLLDQPVQRFVQDHRTQFGDHIARGFRELGEVGVLLPGTIGVLAAGTVTGHPELERSGGRLFVSVGVASVVTVALKLIVGRERPMDPDSSSAWRFSPLAGLFGNAFPSGHSALAFALATTLADISTSNVVRALLYSAAGGTAWSRVNDNRHWFSDVVFGSLVGVAASKLTTGRWTILGIETPDYLAIETEDRADALELALSAAAGIGVFQLAKLTTASELAFRPHVTRLENEAWALGVSLAF